MIMPFIKSSISNIIQNVAENIEKEFGNTLTANKDQLLEMIRVIIDKELQVADLPKIQNDIAEKIVKHMPTYLQDDDYSSLVLMKNILEKYPLVFLNSVNTIKEKNPSSDENVIINELKEYFKKNQNGGKRSKQRAGNNDEIVANTNIVEPKVPTQNPLALPDNSVISSLISTQVKQISDSIFQEISASLKLNDTNNKIVDTVANVTEYQLESPEGKQLYMKYLEPVLQKYTEQFVYDEKIAQVTMIILIRKSKVIEKILKDFFEKNKKDNYDQNDVVIILTNIQDKMKEYNPPSSESVDINRIEPEINRIGGAISRKRCKYTKCSRKNKKNKTKKQR